jgi:hypothetical protein
MFASAKLRKIIKNEELRMKNFTSHLNNSYLTQVSGVYL